LLWKAASSPPQPAMKSAVVTPKPISTKPNTSKNTSGEAPRQLPGGPYKPRDLRWKEWNEKEAQDPFFQWKTPIEFYGKVVDENEQPIEGAVAEIIGTDLSKTGNFKFTLKSDANGLISFDGIKGKGFDMLLSKEGYYTCRDNSRAFEYAAFWEGAYHVPDPNQPVIFRLRKKGEAEPLIKRYLKIPLPRDGSVVRLDLMEGKTSEHGQLELQAWCSEKNAQGRFDWRLVLRMLDGGVKETNEEFAFLAPEDSYLESYELEMPTSLGENWKASVEQQVYVVFGTPPRYARLNFRMTGIGSNFYMDQWLNPTGSRNLEYDKEKEVSLQRIADVGLERALEEARQRRPKTAEEQVEERRRLQGQPMGTVPE